MLVCRRSGDRARHGSHPPGARLCADQAPAPLPLREAPIQPESRHFGDPHEDKTLVSDDQYDSPSPILRRDMPDSRKFTPQTMLTKETFSGRIFTAPSYLTVLQVARARVARVPARTVQLAHARSIPIPLQGNHMPPATQTPS